jgi:two-component sensor histidine kinase
MMQTINISSTEQHFSEARLLLREFSHRINNEFASAIGMISVAARHSGSADAKAALAAVQDQLYSYARVHHALRMPEHNSWIDAAAYLRQLCHTICSAKLSAKRIELVLIERPFQMESERCWRLGLIVSELITNSARHAFCDKAGLIRVEVLPSLSVIECRVTDNGTVGSTIQPGNGTKIMASLAKSLGGTIHQHFGSEGATAVLIFPNAAMNEADRSTQDDDE